jgi:hypothetical protein
MPPWVIVALVAVVIVLVESDTAGANPLSSLGSLLTGGNGTMSNPWFLAQSPTSGLQAFALAIAHAEQGAGFTTGSFPGNNPGDIEAVGGGLLNTYATLDDGVNALVGMLQAIAAGSSLYPIGQSIGDMAVTYTGNDDPTDWATNVSYWLTQYGYPSDPTTIVASVLAA